MYSTYTHTYIYIYTSMYVGKWLQVVLDMQLPIMNAEAFPTNLLVLNAGNGGMIHNWLVVWTPLKNMNVNWDD